MKSFFWKFVICVLPCALAGWATASAVSKYQSGDSGGFKIGTDLSGGTNLVYEIDLQRTRDASKADGGFDPGKDLNTLATALKRRIDPNDLYNIVIRPAGGEGRVEIILPTGGVHRAKKAQDAWDQLLEKLTKLYGSDGKKLELTTSRGKTFELADKIQLFRSADLWETKLYGKDKLGDAAWKAIKKEAIEYWAGLEPFRKELEAFEPTNRLEKLKEFILEKLRGSREETTDKVIATWVKNQAWDEMMTRIRANWPDLNLDEYKEEMKQIQADSFEQLVGFTQSQGVLIAQAGMSAIEPLVGTKIPLAQAVPPRAEVEKFITEYYGDSAESILKKINELSVQEGLSRDLNMEEVQRIKDLIPKVGALEFRILANSEDDDAGMKAARALLNDNNPAFQEKVKKAQETGAPPPAPEGEYTVSPNKNTQVVRYEWVEIGPQQRKSLHLNNDSRNDPYWSHAWKEALINSKTEKAFHITERAGSTRKLLQGSLFFRRECKNRNLPEEERRKKEVEYFILTRTPELDADGKPTPKIGGEYLTFAQASLGDGISPSVSFAFNNTGGRLFGNITRKNTPTGSGGEESQVFRHLAIILDDQVMSAPRLNTVITNSGQITGDFTRKEVDSLVNILRAGQLPATLKPQPVSETTMGPTLGADTINRGVWAVLLAFIAVLAFMIVYYRFAGLVASVALLANLLLTVGFMVFVQATFTLPGLAGLVLMLGMAVDANVLIYERLREERERGAALSLAIRNGYDRALPTIIDTHLSSIFTAIVLYVVGNDQLKGFGVSLTAGLLISLFTSLYMTRVIFDFWQSKGWLTQLSMMRLFHKPNIDFMRIRYQMFLATLIISILGLVLFIARLPDDLNIDFTGGTAFGGQLASKDGTPHHVKMEELRVLFDEANQTKNLVVESVKEEEGSKSRRFAVKFKGDAIAKTISLVNPPVGESAQAREEVVRRRVGQFPDPSVEQSYPTSTNYPEANKTPHFTVRTSEKETEIVQIVLDQLLQGQLKKTFLGHDPVTNRELKIHFYSDEKKTKPSLASPTYTKSLFTRELLRQFAVEDKKDLPISFDLTGEGKADDDGSHEILRFRFENELKADQKTKVEKALEETMHAFEARPQPDRLENFDSQLATETRYRALWAILASWAAILVYLWFRFGNWTFGLAAVVCLIHDLFFTLGAIAVCHYFHANFLGHIFGVDDFKIDLASVAALLTLVGYSVNDTIVVFDRIREVRGKSPDLTPKMINDSVNQTLSRTVLASLTTWLVVFVLYVWGGPGVHLFAFVMVVGVIVGTYSSIYIAAPLLLLFGEGVKEPAPGQRAAPKPQLEGAV